MNLWEMEQKERKLLHKQLQLLAKKSSKSSGKTLVRYSEQMEKIFTALKE